MTECIDCGAPIIGGTSCGCYAGSVPDRSPTQIAAQPASPVAQAGATCLYCGATEGQHYMGRCGSVMGATRYTPNKTEHIPAVVSTNGAESNMTGGTGAGPLQVFDSPRAKILMRAWEEGWGACRDAEFVGAEAKNDAFNGSCTVNHCVAEDMEHRGHLRASHGQAPAGATREQLLDGLRKLKVRFHFMGWPAESMWNAGTAEEPRWIPDWRYELQLLDHLLHGSAITTPEKPTDTKPAHEVAAPTAQAAPAAGAVAGPADEDTVDLVGVRDDGEHVNLGKIAMPPRMKAREIAASQFGGFQDEDGSDAEMCFGAMEELLAWMTKQGWAAIPAVIPAAAPTPAAQADSGPAAAVERVVHLRASREKRIYVAGPMTGLPEYNFPAFNAAAAALRAEGWHVENPAEHGHVEGAGWDDYLRYDLSRVATCGAVYLLPGWPKSKGATLEVHVAGVLGLQFVLADGAEPIPADSGVQEDAADPLQGAANWLNDALVNCNVRDIQHHLFIGYSRAKRLHDAANPVNPSVAAPRS